MVGRFITARLTERLLTQLLLAESAGMTVPSTSGPQHAAPSRFSRRTLAILLASIGGLLLLCCAGAIHVGLFAGSPKAGPTGAIWTTSSLPAAPTTASPTPAETASPEPTSSAPTAVTVSSTEICRVAYNGGTIYLYVTSATAHNFKACDGGTPYTGTIDQLVSSGSGVDRRCDLGSGYTAQNNAAVVVYSGSAHGDLKAAQRFCNASGNDQG